MRHAPLNRRTANPPARRPVVSLRERPRPGILHRKACSCGGSCPSCRGLRIGDADGPAEREADAVAARIMRMQAPGSLAEAAPDEIGRRMDASLAEEEDEVHARREDDEEEEIQAEGDGSGRQGGRAPTPVARAVHTMKGRGQPLPPAERRFFEPRFGRGLGHVRLHTDAAAGAAARAIRARAFTHGSDIAFAPGAWRPGSGAGRRLLAHELAHVAQNDGAIRRDFALEPTEAAAAPELTEAEIADAIAFNRRRYDEPSIRLIQDVVGAARTGSFDDTTIRLIAAMQQRFGLDQHDGKVGATTFDLLQRELTAEAAPAVTCLVSLRIKHVQGLANRAAAIGGGIGACPAGTRFIQARFDMEARFEPRCNCADFEYRQFICGDVTRDRGGVVTTAAGVFAVTAAGLPTCAGAPAVEDADINLPAGTGPNYGHRAQGGDANDRYVPRRADGCGYRGFDVVGLACVPNVAGDIFDFDIRFRGEVVQRGHARPVAERNWSIRGAVTL